MNNKKIIYILIVFDILFSTLTFFLGTQYEANRQIEDSKKYFQITQTNPLPLNPKCSKTGDVNRKDFALVYVVKKGDSLLSIAKNELGSYGRSNEIIMMNDDPVRQDPEKWKNLVVGAQLFLPPSYISRSTGQVFARDMYVQNLDKHFVYVGFKPQAIRQPFGEKFFINGDTKYLDGKPLQVGDCIRIIYDAKGLEQQSQALAITHL